MRCFNHPSHEAAGICRNCGRGLCCDCIVFSNEAVACRERCEGRVAAIQRMMQCNSKNVRTAADEYRRTGLYASFSGLLFMVLGGVFYQYMGDNEFGRYIGAIFMVLGLLLLVKGAGTMWTSIKYKRLAQEFSD